MNQTININTLWKNAYEASVISVSGWRFLVQEDEQSTATKCSDSITQLVYIIAHAYAQFALREGIKTLCLGRDSRPSGVYIQKIVQSVLSEMNITVKPLGILPSPELASYVHSEENIDASVYISASHNPIGYNGFKFSNRYGTVIDTATLERFLSCVHRSAEYVFNHSVEIKLPYPDELVDPAIKTASETAYRRQFERYFMNDHDEGQEVEHEILQEKPLHMVIDFNGSARFHSIDFEWMRALDVCVHPIHEDTIAHEIIPEGSSLNDARSKLHELHSKEARALCAYVYDCDGDRGNIVCHNATEAIFIDAQTHFALLAYAVLEQIQHPENTVIVVNGPSSLRIEALARSFGVSVHRTEVGEKNILDAVQHLQEKGKRVVFAGEGSNGGVIAPGMQTRDPLASMTIIIRFLQRMLARQSKQNTATTKQSDADIVTHMLEQLPRFITTISSDARACLHLSRSDPKALREAFQQCFENWWHTNSADLQQGFGITHYTVAQHVGSASYNSWDCVENKKLRGGLSIFFRDHNAELIARMWFRASGTEPVYRILIDIPDTGAQSRLLYDELFAALSTLLQNAVEHAKVPVR